MRIGLDLGRAGVKGVRCDRGGVRGAERRIDPALQGEARHAALVEAVQEVAKELGAKPKGEVHVAVPRAEAIVKRLTMPSVDSSELEQMIRFQAAKVLPFELSEMVLTWMRVEGGGAGEVMFAAVRSQALESIRKVVEDAGYRPGSLEVSTQAAARTLALLGGEIKGEVLLVEVGQANSDVIVLDEGRLVFSRSASVGCGPDAEAGPWLTRLAQEVVRSVVAARTGEEGFEESVQRTGPPDALFLAGGGACLPELHEALTEQLGAVPKVLAGLEDEDECRGARFVVARGLADPRPVSGIPTLDLARRAQARAVRTLRQRVGIGAVATLAVLGALFGFAQVTVSGREAERAELQAKKDRLAPAVAKARKVEAEIALVVDWDARKGRELEVLLAVARALPEGERVYLTQLRWTEDRPMRLQGRAKDWDAVGEFLTGLEQHSLIESATFDSIDDPVRRGVLGVDFSGQAVLVPAGGVR